MSPQDALWLIPSSGTWFWWLCAAMAAPAAIITFLVLVQRQPFDALLVARVMLLGGFVSFALTPLNSGWMPWGVLFVSGGGLLTSILIATNWCEREDKTKSIWRALWCWFRRSLANVATGMWGPRRAAFRPEDMRHE